MEINDLIVGHKYYVDYGSGGLDMSYSGIATYKGLARDLEKAVKYPPGTLVFECEDGETGYFGIDDVVREVYAPAPTGPDLKRVLMELGNVMVTQYGHRPAIGERDHGPVGHHTECIRCFVEWMNYHPEARHELAKLGFKWSM